MRKEWSCYSLHAATTIAFSCDVTLKHLSSPQLMTKWIIGLRKVAYLDRDSSSGAYGTRMLLDFGSGSRQPGTFHGEVLEDSERLLIRRYRPSFGGDSHERIIQYDLEDAAAGNTWLSCSVHARTMGLSTAIQKYAQRAEQRHLDNSLNLLHVISEDAQRIPLMARIRHSRLMGQPL
ncbi:hypothetical protein [Streptomyces sp. NPDC048419]|uniref:hypothetical protein n=1 Tax=Streptomyces sp. NPDC048419 TaxID=3365547 RepID=UPI00371C3AFD